MGIFQLPGTDGVTPELQREPVDTPSEPWRFNNLSHPRSNTSLKVWRPLTQIVLASTWTWKRDLSVTSLTVKCKVSAWSWLAALPTDPTGDIIPVTLKKRLWQQNGNTRCQQTPQKEYISIQRERIVHSVCPEYLAACLCVCVMEWLGAQQAEEVVPFGGLPLTSWGGGVRGCWGGGGEGQSVFTLLLLETTRWAGLHHEC